MSLFPEEPLSAASSDGCGYFPAFPGLKLDEDRYEVVHKLGFGPRSSVWLVKDIKNARYIALKILTVHASPQGSKELEALKFTQREDLDELPALQCHFTTNSTHGEHLCIGLAVMGASVGALRLSSPSKTLPIHVVQKAIGSMIQPLASLHRRSVIHGAVTPDNMLFFAGRNDDEIKSGLAKLPPCTVENKVVVDGVEYPIVRSHSLPHGYQWNEKKEVLAHSSIELHNVGHTGAHPTWSGVDVGLRPPEVIIETSFDTKVDIWMLGCAAFELISGEPLVPPEKTEDEGDQLAWLQAMTKDVIKREMALRSPDGVRQCFFADNGFFVEEIPEDSISSRLANIPSLTPEDRQEAARFIERCLALDPEDRPTIEQLRHDAWLQPGYACSCGYCG
ncbi:hypothetical protein D9619_013736 [Psilocybe cf. subviscida]|uniref:non-specific serine/threonine protein kinase n=1 Tax=Psilocybe cf. subviscida TaxID=2480587 RepID=A0A8H5F4P4_9AGAR|nr:hypothetical protein D9619_013736 [Psilocybe cf. subviscida]